MSIKSKVLLLSLVFLSMSCNRYFNIREYVPTVDFRGIEIKKLEPEIDIQHLAIKGKLTLNLKFRFNNPYDTQLTIPDHDFKFLMRDRTISQLSKRGASFIVPPKGSVTQRYSLELDLDPQGYFKDFMGKDNVYKFESTFYIKVDDYVQNGIARKAVKHMLGGDRITVPFEITDTLRLPLPPRIAASSESSFIKFIGDNNQLNLTGLSPFVNLLVDTKIKIPDPSATCWFCSKEINAANYLVSQIGLINTSAPIAWTNFLNKWNNIKNNLVVEYPGPNTTGYKIYIPFELYNPNEFAIEAVMFTSTAMLNQNYSPYIVEFKTLDGNKMIQAKHSKKVYLTWQTNFFQGNILQAFGIGDPLISNPTLKGQIGVDIGYGNIQIPYQFTIPFKIGQ
ncbi:MAG: hypothetical protein IPG12_12240 [Saprospiraceae bacterium]|nr:hypothetical protein [Saprospiraceae bacterium]